MTAEEREQALQRDREYQIRNLQQIYDRASFSPVFHCSPKYCQGGFADCCPYIAYGDIMGGKYIIRARPKDEEYKEIDAAERTVLAQYPSIEELVVDGWRLD
jgi:hypothetical protein